MLPMTTGPSPPPIRDAVDAVRRRVADDPARAVIHLRTDAALAALGSCQAITYRYWASELGLRLDGVTITVEADFDMGAFFGFPGAGSPAPFGVRCSVVLDGPEPAARYEDLAAAVDEHCPVLD